MHSQVLTQRIGRQLFMTKKLTEHSPFRTTVFLELEIFPRMYSIASVLMERRRKRHLHSELFLRVETQPLYDTQCMPSLTSYMGCRDPCTYPTVDIRDRHTKDVNVCGYVPTLRRFC